jgi:hypothetical protein
MMKVHISKILAAAALICLCGMQARAQTYTTYDTGSGGELLTSLPGDSGHYVLFSLNVGSLSVGDMLIVASEAEFTSSQTDNVRISSQLYLGTSASSTTGTQLDENNAFNIVPTMVEGVPVKISAIKITSAMSSGHVNLVVWSSDPLTVDVGNGRLQVLKIDP